MPVNGEFNLYSDGGVTTSAGVKLLLLLKLLKVILVIKIELK